MSVKNINEIIRTINLDELILIFNTYRKNHIENAKIIESDTLPFLDHQVLNNEGIGLNKTDHIFFKNCEIDVEIFFLREKFNDCKVYFHECKFNKNITINSNLKHLNMFKCYSHGEFIISCDQIDYCKISELTSFGNFRLETNCVIEKKFDFEECTFLSKADFSNLNFGGNTRFFKCELSNCSFIGANINEIQFINCRFNFKNFIDEQDLLFGSRRSLKDFIFGRQNIIEVYRKFEIIFDKQKNYELSGEFHKKRFELQRVIEDKSLKKVLLTFYKWSSDYGENYKKSLGWFGIFFLIFTIIYMLFGLIYNGEYRNLEMVINNFSWGKLIEDFNISLLYSFNNAIPLKKDLEYLKSANIYTSFFSILETFIQTILAALFVIGLRRKFKR